MGYRLDFLGLIPGMARFSLFHIVQTGSGVHPTSYPICIWGDFGRGKAAEA
jgi:hypothetical protein